MSAAPADAHVQLVDRSPRARTLPAARRRRVPLAVIVLLVGLAAFVLRAVNLAHAWEIHIDEITYLRISENVAQHLAVKLYGESFYLHPPAYFFLEGGLLRLVQPAGDTIQRIYAARWLNVGVAEFTAALVLLLAWRVGGRAAGLLAAALFVLDPFIIRVNSRTFLETTALFWIVAGYTILQPAPGVPRRRTVRALLAGAAFGLALLTKDMTGLLSMLPMAVCLVTAWALPRREALLVCIATVVVYLPYPIVVAATGDWPAFAAQKLSGLSRFAGLLKITGFRRSGGPSFFDAILANLDQLGSTYLLLGLGALAVLLLLFMGGRRTRLLALWTASAYALIGYSIVFGTLEEQFFYFVIVEAVIAIGVAIPLALRRVHKSALSGVLRAACTILVAAIVAWDVFVWARVHTTQDNGYEQLLAYLHASVPPRTPIAAGTEAAEFLLDDYTTGKWSTLDDLRANDAQYLIVSARQVQGGYALGSPEFFDWVQSRGTLVWQFDGPTHSSLSLIRVPPIPPNADSSTQTDG